MRVQSNGRVRILSTTPIPQRYVVGGNSRGNPNWVKGKTTNPNGRTPGSKNKITTEVKRSVLSGLGLAGEIIPELPDSHVSRLIKQLYPHAAGIDKYMAWLALVRPDVAGRIIEKIIPIALTGKDDGPVNLNHTYNTPEDLVRVLTQRGLPLPAPLIDVSPNPVNERGDFNGRGDDDDGAS